MRNPIPRIANKYQRLAGSNIADKSLYVAYRILFKLLVWRGVLGRSAKNPVPRKPIVCPGKIPSESYKHLVCVTGFGHSGSGALIDLLSEYDNVTAMGYADPDGSLRRNTAASVEFDIARQFGGLFSIEDALMQGRIFDRDSTIKVFMNLIERFFNPESEVFSEGFLDATRSFLNSIVDYRLDSQYGYEYCPHLTGIGRKGMELLYGENSSNCIFHLKNLTCAEYRCVAQRYISAVLAQIPSKEFLVLDQPLSDTTADIRKYKDYFGEFKLVAVYRDPRDVWATAIRHNVSWVPHEPAQFVRWYRDFNRVGRYVRSESRDFLPLRFEDLVLEYDRTRERVEGFLGLDSAHHLHPRTAFDPAVSLKNVGLWCEINRPTDCEIIRNELADFCSDKIGCGK